MAFIGEQVLYQSDTGRFRWAVVAGNISGSTADLCVFSDGDDWENMALADNVTYMRYAKDMGTGVDEWMPIPGPALSFSTPSRALNTTYQNTTGRNLLVAYSVRVSSVLNLLGGASGRVDLLSDSSATPATSVGRVAGGLTGTVVVGVALTDNCEGQIVAIVPPDHYWRLATTNEVGTPAYTLTSQFEVELYS